MENNLCRVCQSRDGEDIACSSMFLAYRAITLKNINFFLENKELFENPDEKYNVVDDERKITEYLDQEKRKYRALFNLVTHEELWDEEFQFKNAVLSIFFLSLLEQNFWFEEFSSETSCFSEEKSYMACLLHHFLCVARFNTHQTGQFDSLDLVTGTRRY